MYEVVYLQFHEWMLLKAFDGSVTPGQFLKDEILNLVYPGNLGLFKQNIYILVSTHKGIKELKPK